LLRDEVHRLAFLVAAASAISIPITIESGSL